MSLGWGRPSDDAHERVHDTPRAKDPMLVGLRDGKVHESETGVGGARCGTSLLAARFLGDNTQSLDQALAAKKGTIVCVSVAQILDACGRLESRLLGNVGGPAAVRPARRAGREVYRQHDVAHGIKDLRVRCDLDLVGLAAAQVHDRDAGVEAGLRARHPHSLAGSGLVGPILFFLDRTTVNGNEGSAAGDARQGLEEAGASHEVPVALLGRREAPDRLDRVLPGEPRGSGPAKLRHVGDGTVLPDLPRQDLGGLDHYPRHESQDAAVGRHRDAAGRHLGVVGKHARSEVLKAGGVQRDQERNDQAALGVVLEIGHGGG